MALLLLFSIRYELGFDIFVYFTVIVSCSIEVCFCAIVVLSHVHLMFVRLYMLQF